MGLMLAAVVVCSAVEQAMPQIPILPPGVRFGLSNIFVMYSLFFVSRRSAFLLAVLKSGYVLLTRGPMAGLLSFSGGILSLCVIILIVAIAQEHASYTILSVAGAIFHNIGQYAAVSIIIKHGLFTYYLPVLVFFGVVMGCITAALLKVVMYRLERFQIH